MEKITYEYFCEEFMRFYEILGSTKYTLENKENAFKGLVFVAMRCVDDRAAHFLDVAAIEFERRVKYSLKGN